MVYNEKIKASHYKWLNKNDNRKKFNEYRKPYNHKYYDEHQEHIRKYRMNYYYTQQEFKIFRRILLN
jgi:hypothetical protein